MKVAIFTLSFLLLPTYCNAQQPLVGKEREQLLAHFDVHFDGDIRDGVRILVPAVLGHSERIRCLPSSFPIGISLISELDLIRLDRPAGRSVQEWEKVASEADAIGITAQYSNFTDEDLRVFASPKNSLLYAEIGGTRVTDAGIKVLAREHELVALDASSLPLSDKCLLDIASMRNLQLLSVGGVEFDSDLLGKCLAELKGLHFVYVHGCSRGPAAWKSISELTELKVLDAANTDANDDIVSKLQSSLITEIYLHGTRVSDSVLDALARMDSLRRASISGDVASAVRIMRFQAIRPEVHLILVGEDGREIGTRKSSGFIEALKAGGK